jgi:hypothetical protein
MDAATPQNRPVADFDVLAAELRVLRDLLVELSLQLTDIQFESDAALRAQATARTDQLLKDCQSHPA